MSKRTLKEWAASEECGRPPHSPRVLAIRDAGIARLVSDAARADQLHESLAAASREQRERASGEQAP